MKIVAILTLLISPAVYGQTKVFELSKLDSIDFKTFIADKNVIVVGEMHGTTEVPLVVLQLIRQLGKEEKSLTVGLEIESNYQKDIDNFLKHGDFNKLLTSDYFKVPDGRTSLAMGELIKGLRRIEGIKVVCFDIASGPGTEVNRDSLMGVNLSKNYDHGKMIILTGNLHANLKEGYWQPNFKSAIYHFNKIENPGDKLISLNTYFGGGTIWNCMQDGCKEREANSNSYLKQNYGLLNFIEIYDNVDPSGYSGFIYLDTVTASKPLVE